MRVWTCLLPGTGRIEAETFYPPRTAGIVQIVSWRELRAPGGRGSYGQTQRQRGRRKPTDRLQMHMMAAS
jgi:hypothetical protein